MDLSTTYMGLKLKHPVVPSASPLSKNLDGIRRLEDAGAPAIVMYSLFEEQITWDSQILDHYLSYGSESFAEAVTYYPDIKHYNIGPEEYLNLISQAKAATQIPIIGSLNGVSTGGWVDYARKIQQAGADALELNIYYIPTDLLRTGTEVEQMYLDVVHDVKKSVSIPVAVKLSPYFSATANMAQRLAVQGADALVLFNRFYQPDFDLENMDVASNLKLSTSYELRLPLRWVAILYRRVPVDFAITSGVHNSEDVLKGLLAGAKITMLASELLMHGPERISQIVDGLKTWLESREYESVSQMIGSMSQINMAQPALFERANYMKMLDAWHPDPAGARM
jgi:dihydroorotate dehydrogenase (fumarate)